MILVHPDCVKLLREMQDYSVNRDIVPEWRVVPGVSPRLTVRGLYVGAHGMDHDDGVEATLLTLNEKD